MGKSFKIPWFQNTNQYIKSPCSMGKSPFSNPVFTAEKTNLLRLRMVGWSLALSCGTKTGLRLTGSLEEKHVTFQKNLLGIIDIYIYPIGSMYGIYANIGGILMVNVTIYSIHGSYGYIYIIIWERLGIIAEK